MQKQRPLVLIEMADVFLEIRLIDYVKAAHLFNLYESTHTLFSRS